MTPVFAGFVTDPWPFSVGTVSGALVCEYTLVPVVILDEVGSLVAFHFPSGTISFMCPFACLSIPDHSSRLLQPCKLTGVG